MVWFEGLRMLLLERQTRAWKRLLEIPQRCVETLEGIVTRKRHDRMLGTMVRRWCMKSCGMQGQCCCCCGGGGGGGGYGGLLKQKSCRQSLKR